MENLTQITLKDKERILLNLLIACATAFLSNVYGQIPWGQEGMEIVYKLNCPDEIEELLIKLNLDKLK